MAPAPVAFILYWNTDHSEVSRVKYNALVRPGGALDELTDHIGGEHLPIVYSTQGIDAQLLAHHNPQLLKQISESDCITGTAGLWTHALPSFNPNTLDIQLAKGKAAFKSTGFPTSSVGMLPEFDMSSGIISNLKHDGGWRAVLLQRGVNTMYGYRESYNQPELPQDAPAFVNLRNEAGSTLAAIVTEGPEFRKSYLSMLRGIASPQETLAVMAKKAEEFGQQGYPITPFLIDAEAFLINQTDSNPAPQYLHDFIDAAAVARNNGTLSFTGFTPKVCEDLAIYFQNAPSFSLNARPKPKWVVGKDPAGLYDFNQSFQSGNHTPYHTNLALITTGSDYYSAQAATNVKLPIRKSGQDIPQAVHIQSDAARIQEFAHIRDAIQQKRAVNTQMSQLSPESQLHMDALHEVCSLK